MRTSPDRLTPMPTVLSTGAGLLIIALDDLERYSSLWLLLPLTIASAVLVALLLFVRLTVKYIVSGCWRSLVSVLVAPAAAFLLIFGLMKAGVTPDRVHLHTDRQDYIDEVARLPGFSTGTAFQVWDWGGTGGVATVNHIYTLVYDQRDEIGRLPTEPSSVWIHRVETRPRDSAIWSFLDHGNPSRQVAVKWIEDHFYVVTETYE